MIQPYWTSKDGRHVLYNADCMDVLPTLTGVDAVVTDPPYGMNKGDWDSAIPNWLPMVKGIPTAAFCGVIGMRDYPTPDWVGAWVRQGSTQRNGRLRGFNNWEPILFFGINSLLNDVIATPNYHDDFGHPTTKPEPLMVRLVQFMPSGTVCDPFTGSGTTGVACIRTGRRFIGIEISREYCDISVKRMERELSQPKLPGMEPERITQLSLLETA